jgi:tRNA A-37 threonylcarbamoyl transferase component Bud32
MPGLIGQSIGRYHIIEQLGEGGMARVYKAYDTHLDCDVAIKFIRSERLGLDSSAKTLQRFKEEAQRMAKLTHPNIVKVSDYGEFEQSPYLVMEYLPGGTLKQKLGTPIPYAEAAALLAPIARALEYAQAQGIVHRDVKPANILLTATGQPMLSDFGIAKILVGEETTDLTGTGVGIGTPEYMAPEQALGQGIDGRADEYALGVVFYELVTGRKPFRADTPMAVVVKQIHDPLPRPKEIVPELPEAVERVLFKVLAKKPEDRFTNMSAFAVTLEKLALAMGKAVKVDLGDRGTKPAGNLNKEPTRLVSGYNKHRGWIYVALGAGVLAIAAIVVSIVKPVVLFGRPPLSQVTSTAAMVVPTLHLSTQIPLKAVPSGVTTNTPVIVQQTNMVGYKLAVNENFESGVASDFRPADGVWQILDDGSGNKVFQAFNQSNTNFIWTEFGPTDFSDGIIEYRFRYIDFDPQVGGSDMEYVFFRIRGDRNDSYTFQLQSTNSLADLNYVPIDSSSWFSFGSENITLAKDIWYVVRIEILKNRISVYMNNQILIDGMDYSSRLTSGRLGFQVGPSSVIQYDDVKVWQK